MGNLGKEGTSIEGTLLMMDDMTPHVAVVVQAIRDGKVVATTLSDERGRYQFVNLKPGRYEVRCQVLAGYVYYGEGGSTITDESSAVFLQIKLGVMRDNIDFHFAPLKKGIWRNYNHLDGLAGNYVRDIYCDPDGVMWFATTGGVSRYDGKEFVNFTTEDGLPFEHVHAIARDPDGIMWFGSGWSGEGGVTRFDGKEFVNFTIEDGLVDNGVNTIYRDMDGLMWFGTLGGVSRYDGEKFTNLATKDGLAHNFVWRIHQDPDGVLWFLVGGWHGGAGISRYDGKEFITLTTEDGLSGNKVSDIHRDPDGVMWFATDRGISRYDGKRFVNFTAEDGLGHNQVNTIHCDPDGVLWFGTEGGGVSRYDDETFVNFTKEDGLVGDRVNVINHDLDGVLWFGTEGSGISRYDGNTLVNFTTKDGLVDNQVNAIYRGSDGVLWFGTGYWKGGSEGAGISRYDGKKFITFTAEDGVVSSSVLAIHCDINGVMWFGTGGGGVYRYDGKEFINFTTEDGLADNRIRAINSDPDGVMWFGTGFFISGSGISRYDGREFLNFTMEDGLGHNAVSAIHRDPDGVLWFATGGGGVSRYDGKEFINFTTKDGLAHNAVWAIYRDTDDFLWFATTGGVSRYDGKEFVNFRMFRMGAGAIYQSSDGVLWFASDCVSGYDGNTWTSLDIRDGLAGIDVSSILQDSDGFLWFGTEDGGVTRYRRSNVPPRAYIASVTTDQTYRDLSAVPVFILGTRVTIEYSSIDFKTIPEKRQYRCRIREIDSDWRKPTKETSFDWIAKEPGTYTFEVQAIDRDLNYSEPASLKLEVILDPRNHQIAQLKGELAERERVEMERIQRELEDARQIQRSLLPTKAPEVQGFEIVGISHPAKEVSGDFYSYLSLGDNTGIVLADATGKSVKAAMVATLADGMLNEATKSRKDLWNSPCLILKELNISLHPRLIRSMFTAMSLGIIRPDKKLIFSNAGMPYPVVKRSNKAWELEVNGMPLGITDMAEYRDFSLEFEEGDFVVFCSDGVIEAENESGEMYQSERLLEVVQQADPNLSAQGMVDLILGDVIGYVGEEASDDITVVVLRCKE